MRCVGRLVNSDLDFDARRPIILPRKHHLTKLIIQYCHESVHHSGVRATLAQLRSEGKTVQFPANCRIAGVQSQRSAAILQGRCQFCWALVRERYEGRNGESVHCAIFEMRNQSKWMICLPQRLDAVWEGSLLDTGHQRLSCLTTRKHSK